MRRSTLGLVFVPWSLLAAGGLASRCGVNVPPSPPPITPPPTTTTTTTLPPKLGCLFPVDVVPDFAFHPKPAICTLCDVVNGAAQALTGCDIGSTCPARAPHPSGSNPSASLQQWQAAMTQVLREKGYCAGQDRSTSDELNVALNCQGDWEHYHTYNTGGSAVVWAHVPSSPCLGGGDQPQGCPQVGGGSYRGNWTIDSGFCERQPPPPSPPQSPPPTPGPTPTPVPPPSGKCPIQLPIPTGYALGLRVSKGGQQGDSTPFISNQVDPIPPGPIPPANWTGACRAHQCDLSPEKDTTHGLDCSTELCGPSIDYSLSPVDAGFINWTNGYAVKFTLNPGRTATLTGRCPKSGAQGSVGIP